MRLHRDVCNTAHGTHFPCKHCIIRVCKPSHITCAYVAHGIAPGRYANCELCPLQLHSNDLQIACVARVVAGNYNRRCTENRILTGVTADSCGQRLPAATHSVEGMPEDPVHQSAFGLASRRWESRAIFVGGKSLYLSVLPHTRRFEHANT